MSARQRLGSGQRSSGVRPFLFLMVKSAPLAAKKHAIEAEDFLLAPCVPNPINSYKKEKRRKDHCFFIAKDDGVRQSCCCSACNPARFFSLFFSLRADQYGAFITTYGVDRIAYWIVVSRGGGGCLPVCSFLQILELPELRQGVVTERFMQRRVPILIS